MNYRRKRLQPPRDGISRELLEPLKCGAIDAVLKDLKLCSRRLQAILPSYSDELRILERLYYKGKNQHRSALFWKRVVEIRRYGNRLNEKDLSRIMDTFHYSFFSRDSQNK